MLKLQFFITSASVCQLLEWEYRLEKKIQFLVYSQLTLFISCYLFLLFFSLQSTSVCRVTQTLKHSMISWHSTGTWKPLTLSSLSLEVQRTLHSSPGCARYSAGWSTLPSPKVKTCKWVYVILLGFWRGSISKGQKQCLQFGSAWLMHLGQMWPNSL